MAEAQAAAVEGKAIDAEAHADGVKENIAGLQDGFMEIHRAVAGFAVDPAFELAAVEGAVAGAEDGHIFRDGFRFEHGRGGDDFEDRAGSQLRLNGAIEQRGFRVGIQRGPFLRIDADGEIVGIEVGWLTMRENFAGARIQRDGGAFFAGEVGFGDGLQVVVDGRLNGLAGNGFDVVEGADHFADAIDDDAAHAVRAFERVVILALKAGFADDVAGAIVAVAGGELLRRNFADVTCGAGEKAIARIAAALDHH